MCSLGMFSDVIGFDYFSFAYLFLIGTFLKVRACYLAVFAGCEFWVLFFSEWCLICVIVCGYLVIVIYMSGIMHRGRGLCTVFSVLRELCHRKAALTLLLRAGSQQLSVKYGDLYVWLLNGITDGGRLFGTNFFFRF